MDTYAEMCRQAQKMYKKPPLGLKPKYVHDEQRATEIAQAIGRYLEAKYPLPIEWVEEYNELTRKVK